MFCFFFFLLMICFSSHISSPSSRSNKNYFPSGWSKIDLTTFVGLCFYTQYGRQNTLCNVPSSTNSWKNPSTSLAFMCAKIKRAFFSFFFLDKQKYSCFFSIVFQKFYQHSHQQHRIQQKVLLHIQLFQKMVMKLLLDQRTECHQEFICFKKSNVHPTVGFLVT